MEKRTRLTQIEKIFATIFLMAIGITTYGQGQLVVTSSVFTDGGAMPVEYTCAGKNISPPLRWNNAPKDTKSFAIIMDDPDAPARVWVHWVLYNIPPDVTQLKEGLITEEIKAGDGRNDFGTLTYRGPCPPMGQHRYVFKLYALDKTLEVVSEMTKQNLEAVMCGHILAEGQLIGIFAR